MIGSADQHIPMKILVSYDLIHGLGIILMSSELPDMLSTIGATPETYAQQLTIYHGFTSGEERGAGSVRHPIIRSLNL